MKSNVGIQKPFRAENLPGPCPDDSLGGYDGRRRQNASHGGGRMSAPKSAWRARRTRRRRNRRGIGVARRSTGAVSRGDVVVIRRRRAGGALPAGGIGRGDDDGGGGSGGQTIVARRRRGGGTRGGGRGSAGRGHHCGRSACRLWRGRGCGHDSVCGKVGRNPRSVAFFFFSKTLHHERLG